MAHSAQRLSLVLFVLTARYVAAQDILGKMLATDALWSCMKKDGIHSHLQRVLQVENETEETESLESCSLAALTQNNKCLAKPAAGSKLASKSSVQVASGNSTAAPNCEGRDCLVAPMPSENAAPGSKRPDSAPQAPAQKAATYGPMTQQAFARLVQRKRAALRAELQKAGLLSAELEAFLKNSNGQQLKDSFGIPLPTVSKEPIRPRADFEMRFEPQTPAPASTATSAPTTTSDSDSTPTTSKSSTPRDDFDMRFEPQTPAFDPNVLRRELEDFIAASPAPAPQHAAHDSHSKTDPSVISEAPKHKQSKQATGEEGNASTGPARPPITAQQAAHLASAKQAANIAAREAALARKRQKIEDQLAGIASGKKAKRAAASANTTASANSATSVTATGSSGAPVRTSSSSSQQQRSWNASNSATAASTTAKNLTRAAAAAAATTTSAATAAASWVKFWYLVVGLLALVSAVALFVAAAVVENALLARKAGGDWLSLTRGLWRRCRRAFAAARKQLTGHGSDLPLSANEGTGTVARAFAAASAFVHVFWTHLADHRGQHLGGAVTAALHASRRASTGGWAPASAAAAFVPDRSSAGGAYPTSTSCYASSTAHFSAPHHQRRRM